MTPERWQQIEGLYHAALERAPSERASYLDAACGGEGALRREIETLLASHDQAASFIESTPDDVVAGMMAEDLTRSVLGRTLGRYRLGALLGAGGMGQVYRAYDTRLRREVAVKILPEHLATNAEALHRFEREARAVAALSHPNILAIYDFGTEGGVSFAVTELLEGETLRSRLSCSALNWREAVEIGAPIAEGLAAAHAKGIIHRDLKPENVFLTTDGVVKILDFGIARMKEVVSADSETLTSPETTRPGTIMGTIGYMSPEQVRGEQADAPSDLFSLGCVLYEMAGGQRPFARATAAETIAAILKEEPLALAESGREIPNGLERLIRACLEKQPSARLQSARDLAQGLKAIADGRETQQILPGRTRPRWQLAAMLGAAAGVLLLGVLAWLILSGWREQAIDSLAVLPLVNVSKDADAEYLSDGITESIINNLSQLPQLRVMARGTVFSYKGKEVDPRKVGQELKVRAVFTGKLIQRGDTLSIQADLVDAADGSQLWGERYDRKLSDLLSIQAEIAEQISNKLRLKLGGEQQKQLSKHLTENTEAYRLYLLGRYHSNQHNTDGYKKGIGYLNRAVAADPAYALAYAGLAASYYDASGDYLPPAEAMPKVKEAALQALRLDETLAEAYVPLALLKSQYEWNFAEAEREFRRAIQLNPGYAQAHQYYAFPLLEQGRLDEAIAELTQAHELDPLTTLIRVNLAWVYYLKRQPDKAISLLKRIIDTDPNLAWGSLGMAYEQKGMYESAIAEFNKAINLDPEHPYNLALLGHAYAMSGRRTEALKILDQLKETAKKKHVDPTYIAIVCAGLGDRDQAFAWLEKAYDARYENLLTLKVEPMYDNLRSDPRYFDLLKRLNLAP